MIGQPPFGQLTDFPVEAFAGATNRIGMGVHALGSQAFQLQVSKVSPVVALERLAPEDKAGILK